ncbi:MAG TPA: prephenate dehydratase domain-containing protein [Allosphingosinicella sp.]|nr:prephenate dehydratase domain-containing protein [Allosphingosinicella sp.]
MKGVVAYQGEPGAYAHEACRKFLPDFERINRPTFESVADAVLTGEAELGMLPIENNTAGSVPGNRELIERKGLHVRREVDLPIILHLLGVPGARLEEIETVISHPIALAQCHKVLERLSATPEEAINTAVGARLLADSGDRKKAAVASEAAAVANGLTILCRNVHDRADNATTFCIVAREAEEEAEDDAA